jgi:hypothetical protein
MPPRNRHARSQRAFAQHADRIDEIVQFGQSVQPRAGPQHIHHAGGDATVRIIHQLTHLFFSSAI